MSRALFLINPTATRTTARTRDVLMRAFAHDLSLEVAETRHRGHAARLARAAASRGQRLVIVLGGDGTVNETINGLLADGPSPDVPALAVIPGGSTNVFARALGLPRDPVEAAGASLDALRAGSLRRVGLGRADERYFTFCAGLGFDAEVVRAVEGLRASGYRSTPSLYFRTALRHFFAVTDRRTPPLSMETGGRMLDGLFLGVVSNTSPWTYLGDHPVDPNPRASFDDGLDVFVMRRLGTATTIDLVRQFLTPDGRLPRSRHGASLHDLDELAIGASHPVAFQVDGDYLGEREVVRFRAVRDALRVVVPPG
ncbi:MAG: diacylglycerol/lipid kinase family protein [Streptosporangiaceae bacterium]